MLWPLLRGVGVRAKLQKLLVTRLFEIVRASLNLLRINSVDALVYQVFIMLIVEEVVFAIVNWLLLHV